MKKLAFLILLTATYVMAEECDLNKPLRDLTTPIQIIFTDSSLWYSRYAFNSGCSYSTDDGYNCRKEKHEKAFLDTNTYLYRDRWTGDPQGLYRLFIMQREQSTYKIGDVFKDEFMHWQNCGMLSLTYEQADSMITPLANVLNVWFTDRENNWSSGAYETDNLMVVSVFAPYTYPDQIITWTKQACLSETNTLPIKRQSAGILFKNGLVHVPEFLRGETYLLFDVNGKLLQKSIAKETIRVSYRSAILKIGNQKPVLLK